MFELYSREVERIIKKHYLVLEVWEVRSVTIFIVEIIGLDEILNLISVFEVILNLA